MLTNTIEIIAGALSIIAAIAVFLINLKRTPNNLRGYYGAMFLALLVFALAGGIALSAIGVTGLVA